MAFAICCGVSSYSPNALGSPAFGWVDTSVSATADSSTKYWRIWSAPVTCPDRVRPDASVMVPEIITGHRRSRCSNNDSNAKTAALAFSVSKMVSTIRMSAPPSTNPVACSR